MGVVSSSTRSKSVSGAAMTAIVRPRADPPGSRSGTDASATGRPGPVSTSPSKRSPVAHHRIHVHLQPVDTGDAHRHGPGALEVGVDHDAPSQRFGIGGSRNVLAVLPDRTGSVAITT